MDTAPRFAGRESEGLGSDLVASGSPGGAHDTPGHGIPKGARHAKRRYASSIRRPAARRRPDLAPGTRERDVRDLRRPVHPPAREPGAVLFPGLLLDVVAGEW